LRRLIREDIEMDFRLDPSLACTRADPTQIRQIAMNLALNARDAMPHGGRLEFETTNLTVDAAGDGSVAEVKPGEYVSLCVRDSGAGMEAETIRQLFEPFFTTKEQGKGTGLGLATIHGIVNQHGGHISVESEPGRGTCFRILLPQCGALPDAVATGPETGEVVGGNENVLVVEDDRKVRNLARDILAGHGYRVITADGVHEAARVASKPEISIDLLLTDVVMPHANGFELHARIAAIRPGIGVLFMSGYAEGAAPERGALAAGARFIRKPFAPDDLARKVRNVLDSA
jgi:CheY-like chemotaxis protein